MPVSKKQLLPKELSLWGILIGLVLCTNVGIQLMAEEKATTDTTKPAEQTSPFIGVDREVIIGTEITKDRAFLYAPPPNPHNPKDISQNDCMNCHAPRNDIKLKWRAIRPLAHKVYSQCLQCHVSQDRNTETPFVENDFVGLDFPGGGSRATDFSPPTIPHKEYMRENCLSCHGATGYAEIKTLHPDRSQCVQCHVGEAAADYTRPPL